MHLTRIRSAKSVGFQASSLYPRKEPKFQSLHYLKQRSSFFVASLSLIAFITGNMMGEHGWYAFWHSVFGKYDDSLITYTGTVPPIAFVPDYKKWSMYGGDPEAHTYRQVPQDLLIPLPAYDAQKQRASQDFLANLVYSVGDQGSYETGAEKGGSHPGTDIRVPVGTPIRSIANGIVTAVKEDKGGYGLYVVIRHPNVPDPENPSRPTVLHSTYAHLSAQLVAEGDVVSRGQEIALSGQTGFATGPHLHFQLDKDSAPWHPYWPFTTKEAKDAGLTFTQAINAGLHQERLALHTANPMVYVQANYSAPTQIATTGGASSSRAPRLTLKEQVAQRARQRLALRKQNTPTLAAAPAQPTVLPVVISQQKLVSASDALPPAVSSAASIAAPVVASVTIHTDGSYTGRSWETVTVRLVDANGNPADASTLQKPLYLRTEFGDAEFRPEKLTAANFVNGVATVKMLPFGERTLVIKVQPLNVISAPMTFKK